MEKYTKLYVISKRKENENIYIKRKTIFKVIEII